MLDGRRFRILKGRLSVHIRVESRNGEQTPQRPRVCNLRRE